MAVGMNPGFMRTERVLMHMKDEATRRRFRFDLSESPEYNRPRGGGAGRRSEQRAPQRRAALACELAREFGFTDINGRMIPRFDPKAPLLTESGDPPSKLGTICGKPCSA
jgi:hypothetical protein